MPVEAGISCSPSLCQTKSACEHKYLEFSILIFGLLGWWVRYSLAGRHVFFSMLLYMLVYQEVCIYEYRDTEWGGGGSWRLVSKIWLQFSPCPKPLMNSHMVLCCARISSLWLDLTQHCMCSHCILQLPFWDIKFKVDNIRNQHPYISMWP